MLQGLFSFVNFSGVFFPVMRDEVTVSTVEGLPEGVIGGNLSWNSLLIGDYSVNEDRENVEAVKGRNLK